MCDIILLTFRGTEGTTEFYRNTEMSMQQHCLISLGSEKTGTGRNNKGNAHSCPGVRFVILMLSGKNQSAKSI